MITMRLSTRWLKLTHANAVLNTYVRSFLPMARSSSSSLCLCFVEKRTTYDALLDVSAATTSSAAWCYYQPTLRRQLGAPSVHNRTFDFASSSFSTINKHNGRSLQGVATREALQDPLSAKQPQGKLSNMATKMRALQRKIKSATYKKSQGVELVKDVEHLRAELKSVRKRYDAAQLEEVLSKDLKHWRESLQQSKGDKAPSITDAMIAAIIENQPLNVVELKQVIPDINEDDISSWGQELVDRMLRTIMRHIVVDDDSLKIVESKIERFKASMSVAEIATMDKCQPQTVVGFLAGGLVRGLDVSLDRLLQQSELTKVGATKVAAALLQHYKEGLVGVRNVVGRDEFTSAQIKLVAALIALGKFDEAIQQLPVDGSTIAEHTTIV